MKILFIGMGSIGQRHYRCTKEISNNNDFEFISYRTGLNIDNKFGPDDVRFYDTLEGALMEKPDCAIISNPTSMHVDTAIRCAKEGIHLFIEKPLSHSLDRIDDLINIVQKNKLITQIGCNLRFHPAIIELRNLIKSDVLGRLYDFDISTGSYLPDWRPWQDYRNSYSAKKALGGGVILDLIHELDYAYWLFGSFISLKSIKDKVSLLDIETEDIAKIIVRTEHGCLGTISLNYYRCVPERMINVNFEKGSIKVDLITGIIYFYYKDGRTEIKKHCIERDYMYIEQMRYFIDSVKNRKQTENDLAEGVKVLDYALKIKQGRDI